MLVLLFHPVGSRFGCSRPINLCRVLHDVIARALTIESSHDATTNPWNSGFCSGMLVVTDTHDIHYRLNGEARFPAAVQDVKAAIRFLRGHATAHRIDPDRIAIWGKSAGANLALLGGLARSGFGDPRLGNASVDDRVSAIVAFYPPVDFGSMDQQLKARGCAQGSGSFDGPHDAPGSPESTYLGGALPELPRRGALANPANYVTADAPPVYLTAGTADCTVPADQSVLLFNRLRTTAPLSGSRLFLVEGAKHADPVFDEGDSLARVRAFLRTHHRP